MIKFRFPHGLGDVVCLAHMLKLWTSRGCEIGVHVDYPYRSLIELAGATYLDWAETEFPFWQSGEDGPPWVSNKIGWNLSLLIATIPLPHIGEPEQLWRELLEVRLPLPPLTDRRIDKTLPMGRRNTDRLRYVCLHTKGYTNPQNKNMPDGDVSELVGWLQWKGYVVLSLDNMTIPELAHVIDQADLFIGVDSGPLHLARLTNTPAIGVWYKHNPARCTIPRNNTWHIGTHDVVAGFNMVQDEPTPESIIKLALSKGLHKGTT